MDDPDDPTVAAIQFDELAVASELAAWCEGQVVKTDTGVKILLPAGTTGRDSAHPGDWIVRLDAEHFVVMTPEEFAARAQPQPHKPVVDAP